MKKQVVSVSIMQSAKVMAALYLALSLPMVLLMAIPAMMSNQSFPLVMLVAMPIAYTVFGFIFTIFGAWLYNLIAARIGGFEFTTAEIEERP